MRERVRVSTPGGGRPRTVQAPREETDVNVIVRKFAATGVPPRVPAGSPWYGDFSNVDDYLSARLAVITAEEAFARLPSKVRSAVGNDPAELIRVVTDPERRAEAIELGLIEEPEPEPEPDPEPAGEGG